MQVTKLQTGDVYKDEVQNQWDQDPCGSHYVQNAQPDTLEWFLEAERYRYDVYGPWMPEVMEFRKHGGEKILEIGAGMGTDHAQFAKHGGIMHDLDLSSGHLQLAARNFELRGLKGTFKHGDGENIPFPDDYFDLVYSNGVIHHTPNTSRVIEEIYRVLKPGGRCIIMVYAENSLHYWRNLFAAIGLAQGALDSASMGEIMSRHVELSEHGAKPLVKVYTAKRLRKMFRDFEDIKVVKRQLIAEELPRWLKGWMPLEAAGRLMGWNLIIKARKPALGGRRAREDKASRGQSIPASAESKFDQALSSVGMSFRDWLAGRRQEQRQYIEHGARLAQSLATQIPHVRDRILKSAENFVEHRFDLLGSGAFVPRDPDRPVRNGYTPIDWYLDPVRNLRFPRGIPHKDWKLFEMRPGDADVKYPWELARCQHWITLAQAWQLTRDVRFAEEIACELDDFREANPVGNGVNWTCTMDVGIRAANWCLALALLHDCSALDDSFWRRAYEALYEHGEFIFGNLEDKYEVTSNHFLSNVVGLYILAAEFAGLARGAEWDAWCRERLEAEIDVQVHDEGADFESSVPYHRLVTELFMSAGRLASLQGKPLSQHYYEKLAKMVEFSVAVTRPDGLMPVIGDADDGRFHIFTYFQDWKRQDAKHLLAPAAMILSRPEWSDYGGEEGRWEAAWWGYDTAKNSNTSPKLPPIAKLFPTFGVAVARRDGNYLAVTNGAVGTRGFGNHKHNELLGFEYHFQGAPILVDAGGWVYTSDFEGRNLFRSTAYHNTLCVDAMEQNEFNREWLFRLFEKARPEHLEFTASAERVVYRGRHFGFDRLRDPVVHERAFSFEPETGILEIVDRLEGRGSHELHWHFHFAPGVQLQQTSAGSLPLSAPDLNLLMTYHPELACVSGQGWYSSSYGVRVPTHTADLRCRIDLDGVKEWRFRIAPAPSSTALDNGAQR